MNFVRNCMITIIFELIKEERDATCDNGTNV